MPYPQYNPYMNPMMMGGMNPMAGMFAPPQQMTPPPPMLPAALQHMGGGAYSPMMQGPQAPGQQQGQQQNVMAQLMKNPQTLQGLIGMIAPSAGGIPGGSGSLANWASGGTGSLTGGDVNALTNMFGPGMGAGVSPY